MLSITKPHSFSEMMNSIFNSYVPIIKKTFPLLLTLFITLLFIPATSLGNFLLDVIDFILYTLCIMKADAFLRTNSLIHSLNKKEMIFYFLKRLTPFILLNVALVLIFIILSILFIAILYCAVFLVFKMPITEGPSSLICFFSIMVSGLISTYFIFSDFIFWLERNGIIQSIKESYRLVKGKWWFNIFSIIWFSIIFFLPYFIIMFMINTFGMNSPGTSLSFAGQVSLAFVKVIYYPIFIAAPLCLFYNLKSRL